MITTNSGKKTTGLGSLILNFLAKAGSATVTDIADAVKAERKDVSARCWWLMAKEGRLKAKGEGKEKTYSLPPQSAPKAPDSKPAAKAKPAPAKAKAVKPAVKKAAKKKAVKK